jgi:hypothetical protein
MQRLCRPHSLVQTGDARFPTLANLVLTRPRRRVESSCGSFVITSLETASFQLESASFAITVDETLPHDVGPNLVTAQAWRPSLAMRRVWFSTNRENIRLIAARSMPGRSTVPVSR